MAGRISGRLALGLVAVALAIAVGANRWSSRDERLIQQRLGQLRDDVNAGRVDGLDGRAAAIGSFFTEDVAVDLGTGTAPISGRATVMDMVARLQPRTAVFRLAFEDIGVELAPGGMEATVTLTASFIQRSMTTGEESIDAREFALAMTKRGGDWRIARLTAVDTLK